MSTTFINRGHFFAPHVKPVLLDCNFTVTPTNGLGITNLKGQGIQNVFMNTSTTPAVGNNGFLNPNPAAGIIVVQLSDNYMRYYGGSNVIHPAVTGSDIAVTLAGAALTIGQIYAITLVGTTSAADWIALGVPAGVVPAVGVAFIAKVTGIGVGSGTVKRSGVSGIAAIEQVGNPNLSINPIPIGGTPHVGGWLYYQTLAATNASTTTLIPTAPLVGSIIKLQMYLSQSSVLVAGE